MLNMLWYIHASYSLYEMEAQALLPPTLTVDKPVITETDSVTLNCQSPSSVSECYFRIVSGEPAKTFSCLKTLTGTELLKISHQSSPAEVKVKCFYLQAYQSPESDTSSIIVRTSVPPQLRVNPSVITETDSVTLDCQTPSSVSVSQCHFYTSSGVNVRDSSCLLSLTGTELLKMSHQGSSAEVKVTCFYTVKLGESDSPSPHSDTASITIHILKPQMSLQHVPGDHVLFKCSLPISANPDTRCNLYFGEASRPILTKNTEWKRTWCCQFTVTTGYLLRSLRSVQQSDASCDYSLGGGPNSRSPRSDPYSLTDIVEIESSMTTPTLTLTTGLTMYTSTPVTTVKQTAGRPVGIPDGFMSTFPTSETSTTPNNPEPGDEITGSSVSTAGTEGSSLSASPQKTTLELWIWKFVAVAAGGGVTVGCIMLVSAIRCNQRRAAGPETMKQQEPQVESHEMCHLYDTIPEEPAAPELSHVTYSTVQKH
ncbi:uncharacterized protein LOC115582903 [Sparus aurata]|uniref:uncharacterized protein LOC115582903 n=1 Tax=Sparus aurata TaxID=8175 RepID=UPI0011C1B7DA|nr:uncharacterized protein LOC115582903 [Sparus aurata]